MEELFRLDRLPTFKNSVRIGTVSSYDRTGGNDDGFSGKYSFVRRDTEGLVLADLKGPGVIHRVWTPTPTEDVLEFLFDGESQPRIAVKFRELFLGNYPGFPRPLVGLGAGGYYCYVPIPFAKSCVVRLRAARVQFYQINYAVYGPETTVVSFQPRLSPEAAADLDRACDLFRRAGSNISRWTAPPGTEVLLNQAAVSLPPHSTKSVFQFDKGGRIVGLRIWPSAAIAGKARDLLLKISFDGEEPAILCPLSDFFGYAWGKPAMQGLLAGTSGETSYCYFPMPFDRSADVAVISERATSVELRAEVLYAEVPRRADEGKFYAFWRRENPTSPGRPYTLIDTQGRGHLAGVVLQSQGFEAGKTPFFEGDDQTTIDEELVIQGTGSEDFFNGGWYDLPDRWEKRVSFPLSGCLGYAKHMGRTGGYRFFLGDAYAYRRSIRQTIEHGGVNNSIPTDYCSVTYLYSERRPTAETVLPPLPERAVLDPQQVVFAASWQMPIHAWSFERATLTRGIERIGQQNIRFLRMTATEQDRFGPHFLTLIVDLPAGGTYEIYIETVEGPNQAIVQLFQNDSPAAEPVDLYADTRARSDRVFLGKLELAEGRNSVTIKLVGANEKASGLNLDLISVICVLESTSQQQTTGS